MPVPVKNPNEDKNKFMSRCISALSSADPSRPQKQIVAICYSQFRGEAMHPDFDRILGTFMGHFKDGSGYERFTKFVDENGLDLSKAYDPRCQFRESFQWAKPLIQFYAKDENAKYYFVRALTAHVSMNNNDYRDYQKLIEAAPSMTFKPVDINHDAKRMLPFPRTRVDIANTEDLALECTLRVDNEDKWLQDQIDSGGIKHPSVMVYQDKDGSMEFIRMTLLEKSVEIPGDPLTEIVPFILNESMMNKISCRVVDGVAVCEKGGEKLSEIKLSETKINQVVEPKMIDKPIIPAPTPTHDRLVESALILELRETVDAKDAQIRDINTKLSVETKMRAQISKQKQEAEDKLAQYAGENEVFKNKNKELKESYDNLFAKTQVDVKAMQDKTQADVALMREEVVKTKQLASDEVKAMRETMIASEKASNDRIQATVKECFDKTQNADKISYEAEHKLDEKEKTMNDMNRELTDLRVDKIRLTDVATRANDHSSQTTKAKTEAQNAEIDARESLSKEIEAKAVLTEKVNSLTKEIQKRDIQIDDLQNNLTNGTNSDNELRKKLKMTAERLESAFKVLNEKGIFFKDDPRIKISDSGTA